MKLFSVSIYVGSEPMSLKVMLNVCNISHRV